MDQNTQTPPPVNPNIQIDNDKLWGIISYFPFFFVIPLIIVKDRSSFLNYHLNQGILLSLTMAVGYFGLDFLPWWSNIVMLVAWAWKLALLALLIVGIRNVLEKKTEPLPVIGKLFTFLK